jgi:hypothetical protein
MVCIDDLVPRTHELGSNNPVYLGRVGPLLPRFPAEVLSSWFGEQPDTVKTYAFLGYDRLEFKQIEFEISHLPGPESFRDGAKSLEGLIAESDWMKRRLKTYMETHQEWSVPPIVLDTNSSAIPNNTPIILRRPWHLLEGYHRVALANCYLRAGIIKKPLTFWIARISPLE